MVIFTIQQVVRTNSQNKKFDAAKAKCQKDPIVIVKSAGSLFGGSIYYDLYASSNPEYQKFKNVTSGFSALESNEVYGYYCSIDEARKTFLLSDQGREELGDFATNHNAAEQQQIKETYLIGQKAKGIKFYAPKELLNNFKINAKQLTPQTHRYSIGYVGDAPSTRGIDEKEPVNLGCQPREEVIRGSKVATNRYGGDIYLEEDQYNLNIRSYLPTTLCTLGTKVGQIDHADGIALVSSLEEVDISVIANYELNL